MCSNKRKKHSAVEGKYIRSKEESKEKLYQANISISKSTKHYEDKEHLLTNWTICRATCRIIKIHYYKILRREGG